MFVCGVTFCCVNRGITEFTHCKSASFKRIYSSVHCYTFLSKCSQFASSQTPASQTSLHSTTSLGQNYTQNQIKQEAYFRLFIYLLHCDILYYITLLYLISSYIMFFFLYYYIIINNKKTLASFK